MKNYISLLFIAIIFASCGGNEVKIPENLSELNKQKTLLKGQLDSINSKLKLVEEAISKLDTLKKLAIVTTISPKNQDFNHYIEIQGVVKADKSVELHPEMGGTINRIYVKEGQRVSKGQTLAQLDASVINNNIAQAQTQLDLAITSFERQSRLWDQKIGSEMQYLQAKAQKEGLESNLKSLKSQARKMKVIAPFSGTIDEVFAKVGQLSSPQMPFLRIINLNKVYVESEITETYLKNVKKGTEVIVEFPSIDKKMNSKISQVGNFINPNNRSFKTRVELNNYQNEIKANQLADIKINDFKAQGIVIPSYLIQEDRNGNSFVYIINNESEASQVIKRILTVEKEYNNQSFISDGITENDQIIDKGSRLVKNNDEVIIANQ
jgi:RND family efflux transporter MFP subunit